MKPFIYLSFDASTTSNKQCDGILFQVHTSKCFQYLTTHRLQTSFKYSVLRVLMVCCVPIHIICIQLLFAFITLKSVLRDILKYILYENVSDEVGLSCLEPLTKRGNKLFFTGQYCTVHKRETVVSPLGSSISTPSYHKVHGNYDCTTSYYHSSTT